MHIIQYKIYLSIQIINWLLFSRRKTDIYLNKKSKNNKKRYNSDCHFHIEENKDENQKVPLETNTYRNCQINESPIYNKFKKKYNDIMIQNLPNLSYLPSPKIYLNKYISKQNVEQTQILSQPFNEKRKRLNNSIETVSEKVRKLIIKKSRLNNKLSLSTKLNLDTNLSISEEN